LRATKYEAVRSLIEVELQNLLAASRALKFGWDTHGESGDGEDGGLRGDGDGGMSDGTVVASSAAA
jgi:hypothetical protein